MIQPGFLEFLLEGIDAFFRFCLRRVNAKDYHTLAFEVLCDRLVPRVIVDAVDSAKGHEMDDDHLVFQALHGKPLGVDPSRDVLELRGRLIAFDLDRR